MHLFETDLTVDVQSGVQPGSSRPGMLENCIHHYVFVFDFTRTITVTKSIMEKVLPDGEGFALM